MKYSLLKYDSIYVWFYWEDQPEFRIVSVSLGLIKPSLKGKETDCPEVAKIKDLIRDYLSGKLTRLPIDQLNLAGLSPFAVKVLCELRKSVKYGKTISYGKLAKSAGFPGAARAVGSVIRHNPFPLFFPCHRVIKSNGELGLFQGCAAGTELKKMLLEMEMAVCG